MRLTAACVTFSSLAAAVKLRFRPAASKALNPFNDGKRRATDNTPRNSWGKNEIKTFAAQSGQQHIVSVDAAPVGPGAKAKIAEDHVQLAINARDRVRRGRSRLAKPSFGAIKP
jgi:hypothetical protein